MDSYPKESHKNALDLPYFDSNISSPVLYLDNNIPNKTNNLKKHQIPNTLNTFYMSRMCCLSKFYLSTKMIKSTAKSVLKHIYDPDLFIFTDENKHLVRSCLLEKTDDLLNLIEFRKCYFKHLKCFHKLVLHMTEWTGLLAKYNINLCCLEPNLLLSYSDDNLDLVKESNLIDKETTNNSSLDERILETTDDSFCKSLSLDEASQNYGKSDAQLQYTSSMNNRFEELDILDSNEKIIQWLGISDKTTQVFDKIKKIHKHQTPNKELFSNINVSKPMAFSTKTSYESVVPQRKRKSSGEIDTSLYNNSDEESRKKQKVLFVNKKIKGNSNKNQLCSESCYSGSDFSSKTKQEKHAPLENTDQQKVRKISKITAISSDTIIDPCEVKFKCRKDICTFSVNYKPTPSVDEECSKSLYSTSYSQKINSDIDQSNENLLTEKSSSKKFLQIDLLNGVSYEWENSNPEFRSTEHLDLKVLHSSNSKINSPKKNRIEGKTGGNTIKPRIKSRNSSEISKFSSLIPRLCKTSTKKSVSNTSKNGSLMADSNENKKPKNVKINHLEKPERKHTNNLSKSNISEKRNKVISDVIKSPLPLKLENKQNRTTTTSVATSTRKRSVLFSTITQTDENAKKSSSKKMVKTSKLEQQSNHRKIIVNSNEDKKINSIPIINSTTKKVIVGSRNSSPNRRPKSPVLKAKFNHKKIKLHKKPPANDKQKDNQITKETLRTPAILNSGSRSLELQTNNILKQFRDFFCSRCVCEFDCPKYFTTENFIKQICYLGKEFSDLKSVQGSSNPLVKVDPNDRNFLYSMIEYLLKENIANEFRNEIFKNDYICSGIQPKRLETKDKNTEFTVFKNISIENENQQPKVEENLEEFIEKPLLESSELSAENYNNCLDEEINKIQSEIEISIAIENVKRLIEKELAKDQNEFETSTEAVAEESEIEVAEESEIEVTEESEIESTKREKSKKTPQDKQESRLSYPDYVSDLIRESCTAISQISPPLRTKLKQSFIEIKISNRTISSHNHFSNTIMCSHHFKICSIFLFQIPNHSKEWIKWIRQIFLRIHHFTSYVKTTGDDQQAVCKVFQMKWKSFVTFVNKILISWQQYNKEVKKVTNFISKKFNKDEIKFCKSCVQEGFIKDLTKMYDLNEKLTVVVYTIEIWRNWMDEIMNRAYSLIEIQKNNKEVVECSSKTYENILEKLSKTESYISDTSKFIRKIESFKFENDNVCL